MPKPKQEDSKENSNVEDLISKDLISLEQKFAEINRNKQYRLDDFMAAAKEEVVVDNPEQNPISEEK